MTATDTESVTLPVLGMTCASCQHHVERALRATDGVKSARVDLMGHRATVIFDPAKAGPEALVESIRGAGYDSVLPRAGEHGASREDSSIAESARKAGVTLVAGFVAMVLAMPLGSKMGTLDQVQMHVLPWLYAADPNVLRWTLLAMTTVVAGWAGYGIYLSAIRALGHGSTNMNTLVSLGTAVAYAWSAFATVRPSASRSVYFDAVLLILGFLLLGKALEARAKRRALEALNSLTRLRPVTARRVVDGVESMVPLEEIQPGDDVLVLPGERFPVDATVVEGRTTVDESMLTGESTPLERGIGGKVLAGSLNYDGAVVSRAESLGEATVLAQITRMMEQAQGSRAPMERLADRASAIFVPTVLALAVATFTGWMIASGSIELALANTVAVLVIACPCAMGLAVPAALTVAVGRGAQLGVLLKGGEALERLGKLDAVVMDKTGTLTVGRPVLKAVHVVGATESSAITVPANSSTGAVSANAPENNLLRLAAAAEERSNHPLAHAVVDSARKQGLNWKPAEDVQVLPGRGLSARVEDRDCLLGNEALFAEFMIKLPEAITPPEPGVTRLWMALDRQAVGYFDAKDALRPEAAEAVTDLRRAGLRVIMLTGDSKAAAEPIARQAGIEEVEAGLDPAGKLDRIRELQKQGLRVAMVGDGINDAASLAQADAGIAMGSGADLAQEAGDVLLLRTQPKSIPAALGLARSTIRVMRQNLGWAVGYNIVGIPIAAGVLYPAFHILLTPWIAAAAMAMSSVCVVANSLRLRGWQPE